jgi:hypothetical protein
VVAAISVRETPASRRSFSKFPGSKAAVSGLDLEGVQARAQ